jgi:hypothetical protein
MIFRRFSAPGDTNGRVVTCPKTKLRISTGVETDVASLRQSWSQTLRLACPHCGAEHEISLGVGNT